jgi:hypothetical protein
MKKFSFEPREETGMLRTVPMSIDQIVEETRHWPDQLVAELIDRISLAKHGRIDPQVEKASGEVAFRRMTELESGRAKAIPGKEVAARIRKIVGR